LLTTTTILLWTKDLEKPRVLQQSHFRSRRFVLLVSHDGISGKNVCNLLRTLEPACFTFRNRRPLLLIPGVNSRIPKFHIFRVPKWTFSPVDGSHRVRIQDVDEA
jgi:hypothetical protein